MLHILSRLLKTIPGTKRPPSEEMSQAEAEEAEREPPSEHARGAGWDISAGMVEAERLEFSVV